MKSSFRTHGGRGLFGVALGSLGALGALSLGAMAATAGCSSAPPPSPPTPAVPTATQVAQVQPAPPQPAPTPPQPQPVPPQPAPKPAPTPSPTPSPSPAASAPQQPTPTVYVPTPVASTQAPEPPPPKIQPIGVTGPECVIKGTSPIAKGVQLFNAPTGGRAIAVFTGNYVPMALSDIPKDPVSDRSKLVTSVGTGSLRLVGYVPTSEVSAFTTRDIPVMAGNVWLASAYKVKLVAATPSAVTVELTVAGSSNQTVRASTTCDALALQRGTPVPVEVPGNGRGYLTKESSIAVYDQPNGNAVFSFQMLEGSSQLFWSTESRAGFVHGRSRGDLVVDGWLPLRSLEPIKKGEMMDQYIPPQTQVQGAQLVFESPPRVATATKEILVRARRDEKSRPIGALEVGTEVYVMETIAGWTNVLPKSLHVLPPDGGGFWIPAGDVPN